MAMKRVLLGSVASLLAFSGAKAADAVVAAAPEPAEYVRVCDAFGTGYFYIPGTETCLKFSGEIRATLGVGKNSNDKYTWGDDIRTRLLIETKSDSEVGTIGTGVQLQSQYSSGSTSDGFKARQAYITVGGLTVGRFAGYADDPGLPGEVGNIFQGQTVYTSAAYNYKADAFEAGIRVDDIRDSVSTYDGLASGLSGRARNIGLQAELLASVGSANLSAYGFYDFAVDKGGILGQAVIKNVGPGTVNFIAAYNSGANVYSGNRGTGKWNVAASYTLDVTDKFALTPEVSYYGDYNFTSGHAWQGDLFATYQFAKGLKGAVDVKYNAPSSQTGEEKAWSGYLRLTRTF